MKSNSNAISFCSWCILWRQPRVVQLGFRAVRLLLLVSLLSDALNDRAVLAQISFSQVTSTVVPGLDNGKVAWGDVNNDGWVDFAADGELYLNDPNNPSGHIFTQLATVGKDGLFGDYDNNGYLDFFSYHEGNMWENQSGLGFTEVTVPGLTGHQDLPTVSRGAAWSDHDLDGSIDLYISGYENGASSIYYADATFANNQGSSFTGTWTQSIDTSVAANNPRPGRGVTAADFDRDGDTDIYVSYYRLEPNGLRISDGTTLFTDQAGTYGALGGTANGAWAHSIGSAWGDFNNDGEIDLFVGNFAHEAGFSGPARQPESRFLRNLGSGNPDPNDDYTFNDEGQGGVFYQETYSSPVAGDYDNDGDLDLFFTVANTTAGSTSEFAVLYSNDGTGNFNFTDVTSDANLTGLQNNYQAGFADYDNDGALDLITGGHLYRNNGNSNNWLKVKLVGDGQDVSRDAVGAQVRITSGNDTFTRQVEFGTGEGNQNDPTLHFGLGTITGTVDLEILWPGPGGGQTETVQGLAVNDTHTIIFSPSLQEYQWVRPTAGGSWHTGGNWSTGQVPDDDEALALFDSSYGSPSQIDMIVPITVGGLEFDSSTSYTINGASGSAILTLESFAQTASITATQGDHSLDVRLDVLSDTVIDIGAGASLTLIDPITLNSSSIDFSSSAGTLNINNIVVGGSTITAGGTLGTVGTTGIGADLIFTGSSTLAIDLGDAITDHFNITADATLDGLLDVTVDPGHIPNGSYTVLTASGTLTDNGLMLHPSDTGAFTLDVDIISGIVSLIALTGGIGADFDDNDIVDGLDFLIWQRNFPIGSGASQSEGDADDNGTVDAADLAEWELQFGGAPTLVAGVRGGAAVPEPTTVTLLLSAAMACLACGSSLFRIHTNHSTEST